MSRNGSGTYTVPSGSFNPAVDGANATASDWNTLRADLETAMSASIANDGQTTITANLPMAGYRHTGVGNASARTDYLAAGQFQDAGPIYAVASSSATAWAVTLSPAITSYTAGQRFFVKCAVANSSALTVNFNSLGAKSVKKFNDRALVSGDIEAGQICELAYDGTNFQLLSAVANPFLTPTTTRGDLIRRGASADERVALGTTGYALTSDGTDAVWAQVGLAGIAVAAKKESLVVAVTDETTVLTTGTAKVTFRMPYAMTITDVRASLVTAQSSGNTVTIDINEGGTTIISTKLTIDNGEKTSTTAATPAVISDASIADDAEMTVDIDQVGASASAKGLKITLIGYQV